MGFDNNRRLDSIFYLCDFPRVSKKKPFLKPFFLKCPPSEKIRVTPLPVNDTRKISWAFSMEISMSLMDKFISSPFALELLSSVSTHRSHYRIQFLKDRIVACLCHKWQKSIWCKYVGYLVRDASTIKIFRRKSNLKRISIRFLALISTIKAF